MIRVFLHVLPARQKGTASLADLLLSSIDKRKLAAREAGQRKLSILRLLERMHL